MSQEMITDCQSGGPFLGAAAKAVGSSNLPLPPSFLGLFDNLIRLLIDTVQPAEFSTDRRTA